MSKKPIFRQIIAEFIEKPLPAALKREVDIPLDIPKIISLPGPRRAGKTYCLFYVMQQLHAKVERSRLVYLNFEDDRLFPLELQDMDSLLQAYFEMYPTHKEKKVWFFFDEIQEVPNWEKFIRRVWDTENCRIYLTGSSSRLLSRELATALRGRTLPFEIFPLNFKEFLHFNGVEANRETSKGMATLLHWFDRWLQQGGFPELVFLPETVHRRTIVEYIDLMLYKDLVERFALKSPSLLKYLLKYLVSNLANPMSVNKIFHDLKSRGFKLSRSTVYDYLSHLEEAFLIFRVNIWHRSVRSQAQMPAKLYVIDPAFKYAMTIGEDRGRILENAIFLHLRQQGLNVHYLRNKQEVDFYWEHGSPLNVCLDFYTEQTKTREIKGMLEALNFLGETEGLILTRDHTADIQVDNKHIAIRPAWEYLLR
ncbi:MAG: ATP-binding protein [Bacteroidetes bacterium]|nr:MAG: ATP-binding protein [Bacteroidota bacterium]